MEVRQESRRGFPSGMDVFPEVGPEFDWKEQCRVAGKHLFIGKEKLGLPSKPTFLMRGDERKRVSGAFSLSFFEIAVNPQIDLARVPMAMSRFGLHKDVQGERRFRGMTGDEESVDDGAFLLQFARFHLFFAEVRNLEAVSKNCKWLWRVFRTFNMAIPADDPGHPYIDEETGKKVHPPPCLGAVAYHELAVIGSTKE